MLKKLLILSLVVLAIAFGTGLGVWSWAKHYFESSGPLTHQTAVIIPKGAPLSSIAELLAEQNVIQYPKPFTLILRVKGENTNLQAGEYLFYPEASPRSVYEKLAQGDTVIRQITIPEGLYTSQILGIIDSTYGLKGELPEDIKEGELLPESYHYHYGDSKTSIIERMRTAMRENVEELWQTKVDNLPFNTIREAITLASIVEKETAVPDERKRVAAVFVNRLRKQMRLQSDPTVIYALTQGQSVLERLLTTKDLQIPSEYNTYVVFGLPPAPIANPGRDAIDAVLNPLITDEYYFVADGTGGHAFGKTLKEHNANVRKWRKIQKEQRNQ